MIFICAEQAAIGLKFTILDSATKQASSAYTASLPSLTMILINDSYLYWTSKRAQHEHPELA